MCYVNMCVNPSLMFKCETSVSTSFAFLSSLLDHSTDLMGSALGHP